MSVDTVIHASKIVPVVPADKVFTDSALCIANGRIVEICPSAEARTKHASATHVERPNHVLMPGLVNAHTHLAGVLMRSWGDDLALDKWLQTKIWPVEMAMAFEEFVEQGTEVALAEMIKSGTTTMNDMYFWPGSAADAMDRAGVRGRVGLVALDFPSTWAKSPEEYREKGAAVHAKLESHPLISTSVAPHAPYTVSDGNLVELMNMAKKFDVPYHVHLHETTKECDDSENQTEGSMLKHQSDQPLRPMGNFKRLGLLNERLMAVHMTNVTEDEMKDLAAAKASVVHCPVSNLKLASGFCEVHKLMEHGINVALGTDSAGSNNSLDMFAEMKTAAILAKAVAKDPTAVSAMRALEMATINGAKAMLMEKDIGSLEAGKCADVIAIRMDCIEATPNFDIISSLVYSTASSRITDVWVQGKTLLKDGKLSTLNEEDVMAKGAAWQAKIEEKFL